MFKHHSKNLTQQKVLGLNLGLIIILMLPIMSRAQPLNSSVNTEIKSTDLKAPTTPIKLSPARRVFSTDLDRDGSDELLIAHNASLEAWRWNGSSWEKLWTTEGPGVAQLILSDTRVKDFLVAWGMGRGKMNAPITISAIDPLSGVQRQVWNYQGGRSQVVAMQWVNIDQDADLELMVAHFINKYHTRRVILDDLTQSKPTESVSASIRMGTSWVIADLDQKPGLEEVIGRVYGDVKGEYGDLSTRPFKPVHKLLQLDQVIATERGVKYLAHLPEVSEGLLFSDGWVAAYGKNAKATLKRLRWINDRMVVEQLATSPQEFTFFNFWTHQHPTTQKTLLFAQGNQGVNLIIPRERGSWSVKQLLKTPPIVNLAVGYAGGVWWVFTPHEDGAKAHRLPSLPIE